MDDSDFDSSDATKPKVWKRLRKGPKLDDPIFEVRDEEMIYYESPNCDPFAFGSIDWSIFKQVNYKPMQCGPLGRGRRIRVDHWGAMSTPWMRRGRGRGREHWRRGMTSKDTPRRCWRSWTGLRVPSLIESMPDDVKIEFMLGIVFFSPFQSIFCFTPPVKRHWRK